MRIQSRKGTNSTFDPVPLDFAAERSRQAWRVCQKVA